MPMVTRGRAVRDRYSPRVPSTADTARVGTNILEVPPERRTFASEARTVPPTAIHQAAILALFAGVIGLASDLGSTGSAAFHHVPILLDVCTAALGAALWPLAPHGALRKWLGPALPLIAFTMVALNDVLGTTAPAVVGGWILIVFVWVGLWFPRGSTVALVPFAVAAYVLPLLYGAPRSHSDLLATAILMPIAVLVGEVVASRSAALRQTNERQQELLSNLGRASLTDPLTGIGNRRLGDMLVETLAADDAVVMLDLDNFKAVNDRYGHPAGDEVLRALGAHLKACLRGNDAAARVGGEEFLLVLRGLDGRAAEVAERVVRQWREGSPAATLSAGVAVHHPGMLPSRTYARADQALYAAKAAGRDRVVEDPH